MILKRVVYCLFVSVASLFLSTILTAEQFAQLKPNANKGGQISGSSRATVQNGAMNQPAWRMAPEDGRIVFRVKCDPRKRNYVSVRFWSEEKASGKIQLRTKNGDAIAFGRMDHSSSSNLAPKKWYLRTTRLPQNITKGKTTIELQLTHDADSASRHIYAITTHTQPYLRLGSGVPVPQTPEPYALGTYEPPTEEKMKKLKSHLLDVANRQAEWIMKQQRYAPDWREKVNSGKWHPAMVGAVEAPDPDWNTLKRRKSYLGGYLKKHNAWQLTAPLIFARAYTMPGGKFENDPNTLERVALALDWARRAQGKNGGYMDVHSGAWVGGPDRGVGEGVLEGGGHRAQAKAFLMVHDDLKSSGLLKKKIDDDANRDTPRVVRGKAYQDLFAGSVSFLTSQRGHAPNQELLQVNGIAPARKALQKLNGMHLLEKGVNRRIKRRYLEAAGLLPIQNSGGNYWYSPGGIAMEPGGFFQGGPDLGMYSSGSNGKLATLARTTGHEGIRQRAFMAAQTDARFWYPVYHEDGRIDLRYPSALNWRNLDIQGFNPSAETWAALEGGIESQIRLIQLKWIQGAYDPKSLKPYKGDHSHRYSRSSGRMNMVHKYIRMFRKLPANNTFRLFNEKGHAGWAFGDPMSGTVAIRRNGGNVFMSLNWHNDKKDGEPVANDIARVQAITRHTHRVANITMSNPYGFGELMLVRYGPFFIGLNASQEKAYDVPIPDVSPQKVRNLIDNQPVTPGEEISLSPGETLIVELP